MLFNAVKRLLLLLTVVWAAATINFFIPRMADRNPVAERLAQMASQSGSSMEGLNEMSKSYEQLFGLDKPLFVQYGAYLRDIVQMDFGYSIANYPLKVVDQIAQALPWTICLLGMATLLSFLIGTTLGALASRRSAPRLIKLAVPAFMVLSAIPFYLVGLVLVYFLAFRWQIFPTGGGFTLGNLPSWNLGHALDVFYHALLPGLSIILASIGFWALGMRGMMVTLEGEDYMNFAQAKGLEERTIFFRYGVRNALLPQITTLALSLGKVVTGAILVEMVFGYPGIGNLMFEAIKLSDYFTIYGCVMVIVLTVALSMLFMDLIYPLLDPRTQARKS
jgi:peptide/nickel transport system permease protein